MSIEARTASLWDNLRLLLFVALPGALWGLVAPNRLGVALLCRLDVGRATLGFLADLRRKYGCDHLWVWFPFRRTLRRTSRSGCRFLQKHALQAVNSPEPWKPWSVHWRWPSAPASASTWPSSCG